MQGNLHLHLHIQLMFNEHKLWFKQGRTRQLSKALYFDNFWYIKEDLLQSIPDSMRAMDQWISIIIAWNFGEWSSINPSYFNLFNFMWTTLDFSGFWLILWTQAVKLKNLMLVTPPEPRLASRQSAASRPPNAQTKEQGLGGHGWAMGSQT